MISAMRAPACGQRTHAGCGCREAAWPGAASKPQSIPLLIDRSPSTVPAAPSCLGPDSPTKRTPDYNEIERRDRPERLYRPRRTCAKDAVIPFSPLRASGAVSLCIGDVCKRCCFSPGCVGLHTAERRSVTRATISVKTFSTPLPTQSPLPMCSSNRALSSGQCRMLCGLIRPWCMGGWVRWVADRLVDSPAVGPPSGHQLMCKSSTAVCCLAHCLHYEIRCPSAASRNQNVFLTLN